MKRFGQTIRIKPEYLDLYMQEHANVWPGVLAQIKRSNIQNYSIYLHEDILFAYFEYTGNDYKADMAAMAADPETIKWWDYMKPMQSQWPETPLEDWWLNMKEVFHLD